MTKATGGQEYTDLVRQGQKATKRHRATVGRLGRLRSSSFGALPCRAKQEDNHDVQQALKALADAGQVAATPASSSAIVAVAEPAGYQR
jgi:hypothetical protein